jgi:hypothetical protein
MEITLSSKRQNKKDTTVFFTLIDIPNTFKWHCDIQQINLTDSQIQSWLEANIEMLRCGIYRKIYLEAQIKLQDKETELQAWLKWISNGHKNIDNTITPPKETIIEPAEWEDTW